MTIAEAYTLIHLPQSSTVAYMAGLTNFTLHTLLRATLTSLLLRAVLVADLVHTGNAAVRHGKEARNEYRQRYQHANMAQPKPYPAYDHVDQAGKQQPRFSRLEDP